MWYPIISTIHTIRTTSQSTVSLSLLHCTRPQPDSSFMKKLPPGSEASNVLVGEVDFLSHPIIAFVRLARGQYLGDITEVPIPTRFIFIMLGPVGEQERYHEIGCSISTLVSDEVRGREALRNVMHWTLQPLQTGSLNLQHITASLASAKFN